MAGGGAGFVGRRQELAAVTAVVDSLDRAGSMLAVQVEGEPGIGKSRLLAELCAQADTRNYLVLTGRAAEFEVEQPFGVFVDAMDDYLAALEPARLQRLDPMVLSELATAFPSLSSHARPERGALQAERYRTYRAVRTVLEELSTSSPIVIALDDIQWADPASTELLAHLLAHPPQCSLLLAVANRPAQTPVPLSMALATGAREARFRYLRLEALTRAESDELIGSRTDSEGKGHLYRESGGNPFYLEQLLRDASVGSHDGRITGIPETVPRLVQASLAAEISGLASPVRELLQGAAVVGDPFELDLAIAAAGLRDDNVLESLDSLVASGLVRPTAVPRRFSFRHPIVRRALYGSAGPGWRIDAHARAAAALSCRGSPSASRAHHVEYSAKEGDEKAIAVLVEAGDAAAARAPATAAHWYAAALRLLPSGEEDDRRRLELRVARATSLGAAGQLAASHTALGEALDRLPAGSPETASLVAFCAGIECLLGRAHEARSRLSKFVASLGSEDSTDAMAVKIELSATALWVSDFAAMESWAREAAEGSRHLRHAPVEATARALLAYATYSAGRTVEAQTQLAQAAVLFDALDDDGVAERPDGAFYLGWAENLLEHFDDAIRHFDRAVSVCRAIGQGQWLVPLMHGELWPLTWGGKLTAASQLADEAVEAARVTSHVMFLPLTLYARSFVATLAGDLELGIGTAEEAVELVRSLQPNALTAMPAVALAFALVEAGEGEGVRDLVLSAAGGPDLPLFGRAVRHMTYEILARAEMATGGAAEADVWARRAEDITGTGDLVLEASSVRRARAIALLAGGQAQDAADHVLPLCDALVAVSPLEAGRTRLLAGRALAHAGDRQRAIAELTAAASEFTSCGAYGQLKRVEVELRRLGRGTTRTRSEVRRWGLESLTQREREIAELVSTGQSNREIATSCYLSEKTVERSLTQIFAKLGVTGRAGVAGIVARRTSSRHD